MCKKAHRSRVGCSWARRVRAHSQTGSIFILHSQSCSDGPCSVAAHPIWFQPAKVEPQQIWINERMWRYRRVTCNDTSEHLSADISNWKDEKKWMKWFAEICGCNQNKSLPLLGSKSTQSKQADSCWGLDITCTKHSGAGGGVPLQDAWLYTAAELFSSHS